MAASHFLTPTTDRLLTNRYMRFTLLSIQNVMGRNGLNAMLKLAGLMRYSENWPPDNAKYDAHTSEYASLIQAIENHFGHNARGQLTRIGHAWFQTIYATDKARWQILGMINWFLPPRQRLFNSLRYVSSYLTDSKKPTEIQIRDNKIILKDGLSPGAGPTSRAHECWLTLGLLNECALWATKNAYEISETYCRAKGSDQCVFEVGEEL